jgi:hypothetical protein
MLTLSLILREVYLKMTKTPRSMLAQNMAGF